MQNEKQASEQLITESTAKYLTQFFSDLNFVRSAPAESLQNDILTYLSEIQRLNTRNANLIHENDELMADHNKEKKELLDIIQGFLIWEEMFPSLKNYNKTHLRQVDDDYEDYRKLVDVAKTKVKELEELNHE